jgi:hypothetical protein
VEDDAILSRTSRGTYTCRVERPHALYEPTQNGMRGPSLAVTSAGEAFLAHIDNPFPYPEPVDDPQMFVAPIGLDGALGTRTVPDDRNASAWGAPSITKYGDGLAIAWFDESTLRVAALDANGAVTKGPAPVPGAPIQDPYGTRPQLVEGTDGSLAVVYASQAAPGAADTELRVVMLDEDLVQNAPSRTIAEMPGGYAFHFNLVATQAGYALVRTGKDGDRFNVYFETLDAAGNTLGTPQLVTKEGPGSKPFGFFETPMLGLLPAAGGFLTSWVEYFDRSTVVRVARLDESGALKESPVLLSNSEDAVDVVEPQFLRFGDEVALLTARGSHIFECGGCVPDHRIELVLVDPETLDPLSDVVSVEHVALSPEFRASGGLLGRDAIVVGARILSAHLQQYHTTANVGSATFACDPR